MYNKIMQLKKIPTIFTVTALILAVFFYLRNFFDLFPCEVLDSVILFLYGPVVYVLARFNLPDFASVPMIIVYYAVMGMVFEKIIRSKKNKPSLIRALISGILIFALIHWLSAHFAAKILGKIIFEAIAKFIGSLFGIK